MTNLLFLRILLLFPTSLAFDYFAAVWYNIIK